MPKFSAMRLSGVLACGILAGLNAACLLKNKSSKPKTLDNLEALGPLDFTPCSGNFNIHPAAQAANLPAHLQDAMRAVPGRLQQSFFEDLKGRIELHNDLAGICWPDASKRPAREDDVTGCVRQYGDPQRPLAIHLKVGGDGSTPAKESYGLVLRFGFVLANQVTNRHLSANDEVKFQGVLDGDSGATNEAVALAFLADAGQRGARAAEAIAQFGIPAPVTLASAQPQRVAEWKKLDSGIRSDFATRVMAEAFHSRYCSAASRASMQSRYQTTASVFESIAADLEGRVAAVMKTSPTVKGDAGQNSSSSWVGWYGRYDSIASSLRAQGRDLGVAARADLAASVESAMGNHSSKSLHLNTAKSLDFKQLLGFLFQAFSGLSSGNLGSLQGLLSNLLGGGGGGAVIPPGNLPLPSPSMAPFPTVSPRPPGGGGAWAQSPAGVDPEAKSAFDKGNEYRVQAGKQPLQWDNTIYDECNRQAQAQVTQGMSHWLVPQGTSFAENIAYGQRTGVEVATTWFNSPGHYRNLMGSYTFSAVGKAVGPGSTIQWCHRFR